MACPEGLEVGETDGAGYACTVVFALRKFRYFLWVCFWNMAREMGRWLVGNLQDAEGEEGDEDNFTSLCNFETWEDVRRGV